MAGHGNASFPRASYKQLEELCTNLRAENEELRGNVSDLAAQLAEANKRCEEHERERREQETAAQELLDVLKDFCQPSQPQQPSGLLTPRLQPQLGQAVASSTDSNSWADLEQRVQAMSARVGLASPQKKSSVEENKMRSPLRRSSFRRSMRLSVGGRRDPVGSFGEVVAQIARDRNARQAKLSNQENTTPPVSIPRAESSSPAALPPPTGRSSPLTAPQRRGSSFSRSPFSSLNGSTGVQEPTKNVVCMHTNILANITGDKSATPHLSSGGPASSISASIHEAWRPLKVTTAPAGQDSSTKFAEAVLADITPNSQPEGLTNLLASVVQRAKFKATTSLQEEGMLPTNSESAPLCAAV